MLAALEGGGRGGEVVFIVFDSVSAPGPCDVFVGGFPTKAL